MQQGCIRSQKLKVMLQYKSATQGTISSVTKARYKSIKYFYKFL